MCGSQLPRPQPLAKNRVAVARRARRNCSIGPPSAFGSISMALPAKKSGSSSAEEPEHDPRQQKHTSVEPAAYIVIGGSNYGLSI
jgi:hypothetical protein